MFQIFEKYDSKCVLANICILPTTHLHNKQYMDDRFACSSTEYNETKTSELMQK